MKKGVLITVLLSMVFLVMLFLAGCGASNPSAGGGSVITYGSVTLSGSGSALLGTSSFIPVSKSVLGAARWHTTDGTTFPADMIYVAQDASGNVTSIGYSRNTAPGICVYGWQIASAGAIPGASASATQVVINNVILTGITGTTSTLTLNGYLIF